LQALEQEAFVERCPDAKAGFMERGPAKPHASLALYPALLLAQLLDLLLPAYVIAATMTKDRKLTTACTSFRLRMTQRRAAGQCELAT